MKCSETSLRTGEIDIGTASVEELKAMRGAGQAKSLVYCGVDGGRGDHNGLIGLHWSAKQTY